VLETVTVLLGATRNHMLGLPARCSRLLVGLTDQSQVYDVLDEHVRLGLREISEFDVEQGIALYLNPPAAATQQSNGESESAETL
jgi:hypothetical protein